MLSEENNLKLIEIETKTQTGIFEELIKTKSIRGSDHSLGWSRVVHESQYQ